MVKPNLGAEIIHCGAPTPYVLDAGAGYASYVWNTGDTTQTIAPDSTGHYIVRVTDGSGCETHAQIDITVEDVISGGFTASATNLILGDTVWFVDTAANTTGHAWDFGDGTPRVVGDSVWHVFGAYGTYNVSLIQTDDCICSDTTTMSIQVDTLLGVIGPVSGKQTLVNVYPNPASGSLNVVIGDLSSGAIDLEISDILGASVLKLRQAHPGGEFRQEIKVEHLPGGIYFLSAATAEGRVATRFVKN